MALDTRKAPLHASWGENPAALQKLFMIVGSLSIAVILLASTWGFKTVFTGHVVRMAEADAVAVCELMLDFVHDAILKGENSNRSVAVSPGDIDRLDREIANFVDHLHVIKVKIFDHDHRIVYSTDKAIIGKVDAENPRLRRALYGSIDTELKEKKITDLKEEKGFTQKVVETYVPIRNEVGMVVGSFEIYLLIDRYDRALRRALVLTTLIMAVVLLGTFAVSHLLIGQSVRQVREAHTLLHRTAITDSLTGVANHGYLVSRGAEEFDRARRGYAVGGDKGLGCVLLDLDRFKQVNDTYGHLIGDQVLREFTRRIQTILRPYDLLGRYGGEEFVVLLPEASTAETCSIAERMLETVRREPFLTDAGELTITASGGTATSRDSDRSLEELLKRADDNLYQAKRDGRDRVCCAPDGCPT
ncbi:GGDEF domain-containing protein [Trichlorobacter ammonificans]|uniref:diguanylate cyclase n=1 Tax=Trichlorobacter ammonificans TaxID=2916410 RepID=A0ABM9D7Y4_9BACT|nr:GGDEF domain-containing protein [Trichlorobacter ammonificans]CAH2030509.1 GGDEF domain-containing protein [Trichlorobacter ammonificans]